MEGELCLSELATELTPDQTMMWRIRLLQRRDPDWIQKVMILRLVLYPMNRDILLGLWESHCLYHRPHINAAKTFEFVVSSLLKNHWSLVLDISSTPSLIFHPFGVSTDNNLFMLPMDGFDLIVTSCFLTYCSCNHGMCSRTDLQTGRHHFFNPFPDPDPEKTWKHLRPLLIFHWAARMIDRAPQHLRKRMVDQISLCLEKMGSSDVAKLVQAMERASSQSISTSLETQIKSKIFY